MNRYESEAQESRIVDFIYKAALDPTKWKVTLNNVRQFIGAAEVSLLFYDKRFPSRNFVVTAVTPDNKTFLTNYIHSEAQKIEVLFADTKPGHIYTAREIAIKTGMNYEKYIGEPANISDRQPFQVEVGILLAMDTAVCSAMGYHQLRGSKDLDDDALNFIRRVTPHFVRALNIHAHISELNNKNTCFIEAINATKLPIFLLDDELKVIFKSTEVDKSINNNGFLTISKNDHLTASSIEDQRKIDAILKNMLNSDQNSVALDNQEISVSIKHPYQQHPIKLGFFTLDKERGMKNHSPCIAIIVFNPNRQLTVNYTYLQETYDLTNAEITILQLLLKGYTLTEISTSRDTSIETVRWQMKQIMGKTQTHSQIEIIRTLISIAH